MFPSNDKLTKFVCDASITVLQSSDNIICVFSSYSNMSNFLRLLNDIYINVNWILILVTKSTTGYGYVLILNRGALSWKYVKNLLLCHDLLCKHKLFLFSMHLGNQIVIKFIVKMSIKLTYENERQIYYKLNYSWYSLS